MQICHLRPLGHLQERLFVLTNVCYTVVGLNEDVVFEAMTDIAGVVSFIFFHYLQLDLEKNVTKFNLHW